MIDAPSRPSPRGPIAAAAIGGVRRPLHEAHVLPPEVFHDPAILAYEQEAWFAKEWLCVGREEDAAETGSFFLTEIAGEHLIVVRGNDGALRGFYNVCRHRGATIVEAQCGRLARFQCPYHAWIYDLEGRLRPPRDTNDLADFDPAEHGLVPVGLTVWQGFVLLNLDPAAEPFAQTIGDLPEYLQRYDLAVLRRALRIDYDVKANWKAIIENYSECYHCPGVHPELNKITPYNLGAWLPSTGPWNGSWMEVIGDYETLSTDGATHGRPDLPGTQPEDHKRVYYFVVWPNLLMSLHPDYLMTHRVIPIEPGRTQVICEWFFSPEAMADPAFDPSDAVEFWDLTNRQDWHVCELQQVGTGSRAYTPGRYSTIESGVHAFDLMVADRYAADGITSRFERVTKKPGSPKASGNGQMRAVVERLRAWTLDALRNLLFDADGAWEDRG